MTKRKKTTLEKETIKEFERRAELIIDYFKKQKDEIKKNTHTKEEIAHIIDLSYNYLARSAVELLRLDTKLSGKIR